MNSFVVALFGFFLAVQASPLLLAPRAKFNSLDVFTPTIISPNDKTVWCIGQSETVEWQTANAPKQISNRASIKLHYPDTLANSIELADDFDLRSGSQAVTVPSDIAAGTYQITLFGDSGDTSDSFQIKSCPY